MTQVRWSELDSATYERMVSVLLSTLHPNAERIDGAGGDGGRDVQLREAGRLDFFQLKSQTGRVGDTQRAQIKRSLARAAEKNPDSWTLVIPIDHTEKELEWFDSLKPDYPFSLTWSGVTWLDGRMAEYPQIPRYFIDKAADEVIELLARIKEDEADFAQGVDAVVARMETLIQRLNEIDPFWGFDIARSAEGTYNISPRPKYRGAETDRPIKIHFRGHFPNTDEGQKAFEDLQMAIGYGRPVTVPKEYIDSLIVEGAPAGMPETTQGPISISQAGDTSAAGELRLLAYDRAGSQLAALTLFITDRTVGNLGIELTACDAARSLKLRLRMSGGVLELKSDFHFKIPAGALPAVVLPTLRFISEVQPSNRIAFRFFGSEKDAAGSAEVEATPVPPAWLAMVEALARIQEATQVFFPVPDTFTSEDVQKVLEVDRLLQGQPVEMTWGRMSTTLVVGDDPATLANSLQTMSSGSLRLLGPREEDLFGHHIAIPNVAIDLASARVSNLDELEALMPFQPGAEVTLVLEPGENNTGRLHRVSEVETPKE